MTDGPGGDDPSTRTEEADPPTRAEEQDPSTRAEKWVVAAAVFVLTGLGTFFAQYLSGAYESPDRLIGLAAASAAAGLAAALTVGAVLLVGLLRPYDRALRVLAYVVAVLLVVGCVAGLGPTIRRSTNETWGCDPPREFTVVTTSPVRNTADELVEAYATATALANDGCPTAHGFVYEASEQTIITAVGRDWAVPPAQTFFPRKDIGPRPDVWLTESTLPVNTYRAASQPQKLTLPRTFGESPLVLALPPEAPPTEEPSLPALVESLAATIGVVRPDPSRSTVGLLAVAALYGVEVDTVTASPVDPAVTGPGRLEEQLGAAAAAGAFPDGDEGALLCRFRRLTDRFPGLLLSEQAVDRYNAQQLVGGPCPGDPPYPVLLTSVYAPAPVLDHQVVRFDWDEKPASPPVAREFEDWLFTTDGQQAVEDTGLRPVPAAAPPDRTERGDLDSQAVAAVRLRYLDAHRPRRTLLALDFSGSMDRPGRVPRRSRATVVRQAVTDAACVVRRSDEIGLWVFPGDADRGPRPLVAPRRDGCAAVGEAVGTLQARGNTPLWQTIVDGVTALRGTDESAERRLVVVTDGEDTSSPATRDDALRVLDGARVKVYLVTLGDITCDADPFREIAERSGGRCYDPGPTTEQLRDALGV